MVHEQILARASPLSNGFLLQPLFSNIQPTHILPRLGHLVAVPRRLRYGLYIYDAAAFSKR